MICINNTYTDAYFNIAAEEYLLKNYQENIFMLYRNEPSVIVGKHQNVHIEVNTEFAEENEIKIVRRFSGGGTVFHDLGNLNLTFIETGNNLNFDKFTDQMIDLLASFGIKAETNERRALTVDGLKISGSAQGIHKNRVMYHATLLFSSDLNSLVSSLDGNILHIPDEKQAKLTVKSVKSPVTNIVQHLKQTTDIVDFSQSIIQYFLNQKAENIVHELTHKDIESINELKKNKYATQTWNYDACIAPINNKNKAKTPAVEL